MTTLEEVFLRVEKEGQALFKGIKLESDTDPVGVIPNKKEIKGLDGSNQNAEHSEDFPNEDLDGYSIAKH